MSEVGIAEDLKPRVPLLAFDATLISSTRSHRPNSVTKRPKNLSKVTLFHVVYNVRHVCAIV